MQGLSKFCSHRARSGNLHCHIMMALKCANYEYSMISKLRLWRRRVSIRVSGSFLNQLRKSSWNNSQDGTRINCHCRYVTNPIHICIHIHIHTTHIRTCVKRESSPKIYFLNYLCLFNPQCLDHHPRHILYLNADLAGLVSLSYPIVYIYINVKRFKISKNYSRTIRYYYILLIYKC